jgi:signal transduction histidine kinase
VSELSVEQSPAMPIFTEATTLAVRLAAAPVAILTAIAGSSYQIGSITGLEQFNLPTRPNLPLELAGLEYCHDRVISSQSHLIVTNFHNHPQLAQSSLLRVHGIQAYLGLSIVTAAGDKLGTISILDFKSRQFSERDIDLLQLVSRLVASEFERKLLSQAQLNHSIGDLQYRSMPGFDDPNAAAEHHDGKASSSTKIDRDSPDTQLPSIDLISSPGENSTSVAPQIQGEIQFKLLTHLAQELRTPLTSVLGMASVLQQEVYGSLTSKQKDYLGIIHHSGQQLVTIVNEISQLGGFDERQQLTLKSVDLEMLCQLALQSLEPLAQKKQQQIKLAFGDTKTNGTYTKLVGTRTWLLDKDKVRQIIYYLCLSLIHASTTNRQISIEITNLTDVLQIQIATNDPDAIIPADPTPTIPTADRITDTYSGQDLRISLGLSLSYALAAIHGGKIALIDDGRGYQLTLPLPLTTTMSGLDRDSIVTV